jgi:hypothetical protein
MAVTGDNESSVRINKKGSHRGQLRDAFHGDLKLLKERWSVGQSSGQFNPLVIGVTLLELIDIDHGQPRSRALHSNSHSRLRERRDIDNAQGDF